MTAEHAAEGTFGPEAVFEDPSRFLGLAPQPPGARLLRVWSRCSFDDPVAFTVYGAADTLLVRRVVLVRRPLIDEAQPWGADGRLDREPALRLLADLRALSVAPFAADATTGRDGCHHGLETFGWERRARLVWWASPSGWEAVAAWHARATTLLGACVPPHRPDRGK